MVEMLGYLLGGPAEASNSIWSRLKMTEVAMLRAGHAFVYISSGECQPRKGNPKNSPSNFIGRPP
jgi:hypothetical protein